MIQQAIEKLIRARDLTRDEAAAVMEEIMTGQATPAQFGAFVVGLRLKGETVDELTGLARVMRAKALRVEFDGPMVDTCGTGGDDLGTFNISTVAAFVVAGAGITVAKHGNRAMSSRCGSADILEKHGVKIDLGPQGVKRCMEEVGIGFMFAPAFHPAMKFAVQPRREIGVRTVFNILGPLTNPARAQAQVLGVAAEPLGEKMILVLQGLGSERAMVVHGEDGLDEISIIARTHIWELRNGAIKDYWVSPEELGLEPAPLEALKGGSVEENTAIMVEILNGAPGPRREVVLANAAGGIVVGGKARDLREGVELARESIDEGRALDKLNGLAEVSQRLGQ
ncbi:MAG: anthranilate phosphoribosyltransferase [Chloroflexi bacterium]|nr:anthranilate phosphoribosyltransferase [Chloroflexota bacterium]